MSDASLNRLLAYEHRLESAQPVAGITQLALRAGTMLPGLLTGTTALGAKLRRFLTVRAYRDAGELVVVPLIERHREHCVARKFGLPEGVDAALVAWSPPRRARRRDEPPSFFYVLDEFDWTRYVLQRYDATGMAREVAEPQELEMARLSLFTGTMSTLLRSDSHETIVSTRDVWPQHLPEWVKVEEELSRLTSHEGEERRACAPSP